MTWFSRLMQTWGPAGAVENARLSSLRLRLADDRSVAVARQLEAFTPGAVTGGSPSRRATPRPATRPASRRRGAGRAPARRIA